MKISQIEGVLNPEQGNMPQPKEKWLKRTWKRLKGKKRNIGIVLLTILQGVNITFPDLLTSEQYEFCSQIINALLLGGWVDFLRRETNTGKKVDKKIKDGTKRVTKRFSRKGS